MKKPVTHRSKPDIVDAFKKAMQDKAIIHENIREGKGLRGLKEKGITFATPVQR